MSENDIPGLLSRKQRAYLRGEFEPANEITMRQRIRQRIRTAMLDFGIVYPHLSEKDREMIFSHENTTAPEDELDLWNGAIYALAFLYERLSEEDAYQNFEYSLQAAILEVLDRPGMARHGELDVLGSVMVDIDTSRVVDLGRIGEKIGREGYLALDEDELEAIEVFVKAKSDDEMHPDFKTDMLARVEAVREMDDDEKASRRAMQEGVDHALSNAVANIKERRDTDEE